MARSFFRSTDHDTQAKRAADDEPLAGRRALMLTLGGLGIGALIGCSSSSNGADASTGGDTGGNPGGDAGGDASGGGGDAGGDAALADAASDDAIVPMSDADAAARCTLAAEQEEGPYYVALEEIRSDITESQPGLPLTMTFTIIDTTTCLPLANAAVDLWHCSDAGVYSDEASEGTTGQTYLRGVQITDANGKVTFTSVFPGWYNGRTVHVHIKVHVGGAASGSTYGGGHVSHTGNVFFAQEVNDAVAAVEPYASADTNARTLNADDNVWKTQGGSAYLFAVTGSATTAIVATVTLGVDSTATPALIGVTSEGGGPGGPGGP